MVIKCHVPFSFKKTCLYILIFTFFLIFVSGIPLLFIILILKPQMPDFSLQTIKVESYKLNFTSRNLVVSSFSSLNLIAQNPNKVGLSYSPSKFHVLNQGLVVGLIRIPHFHQPPLSKNVSIHTQILFESLNVSEIMSRKKSSKGIFGIRILGDIKAQVRIFQITLPKIKVALDCDIAVNESHFFISSEVYSMKRTHNHMISLPLNSKTVSRKCAAAILV
ncbi:hypothetical protein ACJIZ3_023801 [Penstemon smallii]|uniref:Late embryogenesis abundant protein LEA-2 subgroup domain-containing protein n=1 Tax=Penstemon smallii TaxID=265156 RepID=A0ABD3TQ88_9LAMI